MGNTSSSYLGTTGTGLGSVGRGGASSQTAGPLQVARDRLRRRQRGTTLVSQMDGPANTLTTQGAETTETSAPNTLLSPVTPYSLRYEDLGKASSLSATQFGIMVRNAKKRYVRSMSLSTRDRELSDSERARREAARKEAFRRFEQGEF